MHRCLQAWAYQGNVQVDDACCTSDFIKIRFSIVENPLSEHLEDHLLAMPGYTSFLQAPLVYSSAHGS